MFRLSNYLSGPQRKQFLCSFLDAAGNHFKPTSFKTHPQNEHPQQSHYALIAFRVDNRTNELMLDLHLPDAQKYNCPSLHISYGGMQTYYPTLASKVNITPVEHWHVSIVSVIMLAC